MVDAKHCPKQRRRDAYELDGYIRSAVESSHLVEQYLRPFSDKQKERIRSFALPVQACIAQMGARFDWKEEQSGTEDAEVFKTAVATFGDEVATVAYGVIRAYAELGRPDLKTDLHFHISRQQPLSEASGAGQAAPPEDMNMSDAAGQAPGAQEAEGAL